MNFITFSTQTTNIFPISNSHAGGQLVTEWNMRSRETVGTDPAVTYPIGPSYVHGENDFEVRLLRDSGGAIVSSSVLEITEGRALVNGHYVETLAPMQVDLLEANMQLIAQSRPVLKGKLAIGIRAFYATEATIAGSLLIENEDDMYLGIQLVVLPEEELITPSDSPTDQSKVTADIRLAKFVFLNNTITDIKNLDSKLGYIDASRLTNIDETLAQSKYVTKIGLNPKKIYSFAGKGLDPETGRDTWEDTTDSLMVWDYDPATTSELPIRQAEIMTVNDNAYLVIPHKQVEGMTDSEGHPQYYASRIMELPTASYAENTVGFVNKEYTQQIKSLANRVSEFRSSLQGKQIYYMDVFSVDDELPAINDAWNEGDYILVRSDVHYSGAESDTSTSPSTMYVVLPGQVLTIGFIAQVDGDVNNDAEMPSNIDGVQLAFQDWYEASGQERPDTEHPEYFPTFFSPTDTMLGVPKKDNVWNDYFKIRYYVEDSATYAYTDYYYGVLTSGPRVWSDAIIVTGTVGLATTNTIGGFYDAPSDVSDAGYVKLNDAGRLVLADYALLRSGTLAYQIGSPLTGPTSGDPNEIQTFLSEYVNDRVAFPATTTHGENSPVIDIYLYLPEAEEAVTFEICGIDSRFNTAVCLHLWGSGNSNVTVDIIDCEKIIIDSEIKGTPVVNVVRSCLYYDPTVFEYIRTCERVDSSFTGFQDLTIWYEQLNAQDPNLQVNGMTITELDTQIVSTEINYWSEQGSAINDNHYMIALKGITFAGNGDIVGCEILVTNDSTDNILPGDKIIIGRCALPQGSNLVYPISCLTRVLKVSGEFTIAYYSDENWYVTDNSFSFSNGVYTSASAQSTMIGTIAFHSTTTLVPASLSQTSIDVWEPGSYHVFRGGVLT